MRKTIYVFILSLLMIVGVTSRASAWIIAKISNMAEDVTTTTTKLGKEAQNIADKVGNSVIIQRIGKGFTETKKWLESNVSKLKSFADEVQEEMAAYQKMYEDSKKIYNDTVGDYAKIASDLKNIQKEYQNIELKIQETETEFMSEVNAQKTQISGQIDACKENMANLKQLMEENSTNKEAYQAEYDEWNAKQQELTDQINNLDTVAQQELDSMLSSYKNQLSSLKSQISQLKSDLSQLAGLSGEEQSDEDALLNTANTYFLQYDEELNPKRQDAIRYNRLKERRSSIISAYSESLPEILDIVTKNNEAEDLGYNASTFDTTAGAWGAAAQLQIDNLKALSAYAHLLIKDLKRQTAVEMSNLTFYQLQKEQKNIAEFNMDDYVYKKKEDK